MKVIIAADSFKGSCSALEVANSIEKGFNKIYKNSEIVKIPVADGGEGTVSALVLGTKGRYETVDVLNPLGEQIMAKYGVINDGIAVIEMCAASGLTLLDKEKLNPLITTTFGTGQLIKSAMELGLRKVYVGLGGSGTNDGGVGMAQALGVSFKDEAGKEIGFGGGQLNKIRRIDRSNIHPLLKETEIIAISDVSNPLHGPIGAAYIFGPQKGADIETVELLDNNLKYFAQLIKNELNIDLQNTPGAGAAGGLGAGLVAFCNASIEPGIEKVLDIVDLDINLKDADLVITGEGKMDNQSKYGKVPVGVAKRAVSYNIPVIAIVGSVDQGAAAEVYSYGIDLIIDIIKSPMTLSAAMERAPELIEEAAETVARIFMLKEKYYEG